MTLAELEAWMHEADVALQVHPSFKGWLVWIYAHEDAAIGVQGEAETLAGAMAIAVAKWGAERSN